MDSLAQGGVPRQRVWVWGRGAGVGDPPLGRLKRGGVAERMAPRRGARACRGRAAIRTVREQGPGRGARRAPHPSKRRRNTCANACLPTQPGRHHKCVYIQRCQLLLLLVLCREAPLRGPRRGCAGSPRALWRARALGRRLGPSAPRVHARAGRAHPGRVAAVQEFPAGLPPPSLNGAVAAEDAATATAAAAAATARASSAGVAVVAWACRGPAPPAACQRSRAAPRRGGRAACPGARRCPAPSAPNRPTGEMHQPAAFHWGRAPVGRGLREVTGPCVDRRELSGPPGHNTQSRKACISVLLVASASVAQGVDHGVPSAECRSPR
jgi:hypothetical protein